MADLRLVTAPTDTPVSMVEAKAHLRETLDDNNDEILLKLKAATDYCQRMVPGGRQFMAATYDLKLPYFPSWRIDLPIPPLNNVTWIKYYDADNDLTTLGSTLGSTASTDYYHTLKPERQPGGIEPVSTTSWPATYDRPDAVTVRFVAGSTDASTVPDSAKAAVLLKLEHLFDPERVNESDMSRAIKSLLNCSRWGSYG